jgi:hypothetical protein
VLGGVGRGGDGLIQQIPKPRSSIQRHICEGMLFMQNAG